METAFLENRHLRIMVVPGKGGDILEFRDKRADVDVLWESDHNWVPPEDRYIPAEGVTTPVDHYPGGWQMHLPIAGYGRSIDGHAYGLHGETDLIPWEFEVVRDDEKGVKLGLSVDLVRYPFSINRELTLPTDSTQLEITETVENEGGVELEYIWQQHITLGRPLLGPEAQLDVPAESGVVDEGNEMANARLASDTEFQWPHAPGTKGGTVDLSEIPDTESEIHDVAYATDLESGWYALTNTDLNLGFAFRFPKDPFECIWYWQAFGGAEVSPYFNRNYNVGLEPTTAYPADSIPDAQRANGTMKTLEPGESIECEFVATTYRDVSNVSEVDWNGTVRE
jgi:galactose mutarotase-like enzyme